MPFITTLDQIRPRRGGSSRWEKFFSFLVENPADIRAAGARAPAAGSFARVTVADPCDPVLFAACLEAELWLAGKSPEPSAAPPGT